MARRTIAKYRGKYRQPVFVKCIDACCSMFDKKTILIVDDRKRSALPLNGSFRRGARVLSTGGCRRAPALCSADLLFLDIRLNDGDGLETAGDSKAFSELPVVIMTACLLDRVARPCSLAPSVCNQALDMKQAKGWPYRQSLNMVDKTSRKAAIMLVLSVTRTHTGIAAAIASFAQSDQPIMVPACWQGAGGTFSSSAWKTGKRSLYQCQLWRFTGKSGGKRVVWTL